MSHVAGKRSDHSKLESEADASTDSVLSKINSKTTTYYNQYLNKIHSIIFPLTTTIINFLTKNYTENFETSKLSIHMSKNFSTNCSNCLKFQPNSLEPLLSALKITLDKEILSNKLSFDLANENKTASGQFLEAYNNLIKNLENEPHHPLTTSCSQNLSFKVLSHHILSTTKKHWIKSLSTILGKETTEDDIDFNKGILKEFLTILEKVLSTSPYLWFYDFITYKEFSSILIDFNLFPLLKSEMFHNSPNIPTLLLNLKSHIENTLNLINKFLLFIEQSFLLKTLFDPTIRSIQDILYIYSEFEYNTHHSLKYFHLFHKDEMLQEIDELIDVILLDKQSEKTEQDMFMIIEESADPITEINSFMAIESQENSPKSNEKEENENDFNIYDLYYQMIN